MGRRSPRANKVVEQTNEKCENVIFGMLERTLARFFKEEYEAQAEKEADVIMRAEAQLSLELSDWKLVFEKRDPEQLTVVNLPHIKSAASYQITKTCSFDHAPVYNPIKGLTLGKAGSLYIQKGVPGAVHRDFPVNEEISNSYAHVKTICDQLNAWTNQFRVDGNFSDPIVSRICAISPTYRACLQQRSYASVKLTAFKQGPRVDYTPMSPELARAMHLAATLINNEKASE